MLKHLVLDEADRLLNMDFEEEIDQILKAIPKVGCSFLPRLEPSVFCLPSTLCYTHHVSKPGKRSMDTMGASHQLQTCSIDAQTASVTGEGSLPQACLLA